MNTTKGLTTKTRNEYGKTKIGRGTVFFCFWVTRKPLTGKINVTFDSYFKLKFKKIKLPKQALINRA